MELNRRRSGCFARVAIKRKVASLDLDRIGGMSGGRMRAGHVDFDISLAMNGAGPVVAALVGMDVVVAAAVPPVERDPDVLEYGAVLVFKLRGARSAAGEVCAGLFDLGTRKLRRLLLHVAGHCDGCVAERGGSPTAA